MIVGWLGCVLLPRSKQFHVYTTPGLVRLHILKDVNTLIDIISSHSTKKVAGRKIIHLLFIKLITIRKQKIEEIWMVTKNWKENWSLLYSFKNTQFISFFLEDYKNIFSWNLKITINNIIYLLLLFFSSFYCLTYYVHQVKHRFVFALLEDLRKHYH